MPRSRRGSKLASFKIRPLVNNPTVLQQNGSTLTTNGVRRSARTNTRNPVYAEENEAELSALHTSPSAHAYQPPEERRTVVDDFEDIICTDETELYCDVSSATVWSSFPKKHKAEYWEQFPGILQGVRNIRGTEVAKWSSKDVADFVSKLTGQERYGQRFMEHEVDGEAFLILTQEDVHEVLKIKLGPALKIHGAILCARISP